MSELSRQLVDLRRERSKRELTLGWTPSLVSPWVSVADWPPRLPTIVAPAGIGSLTTTQLRSADASTVSVTRSTSPRVSRPGLRACTTLTARDIL